MNSMVSSSRIDSLASRFQPYIDELREFFSSRGLHYGTPADLSQFLEHLREPAFHDEMESMVRSILYREDEALPRIELMELIAVAVGGPQVEDAGQDLHGPLRDILAFVHEVSRAKRAGIFADIANVDHADPVYDSPPYPLETPVSVPAANPAAAAPVANSAAAYNATPHFTLTNDRLSQNLLHLQEPEPRPNATVEPALNMGLPGRAANAPPTPTMSPDRSMLSVLRRSYWIPGVILLLFAVAAGLLISTRHGAPASANVPPQPSLKASGKPKPSAYGTPLPSRASSPQQQSNLLPEQSATAEPVIHDQAPSGPTRVPAGDVPRRASLAQSPRHQPAHEAFLAPTHAVGVLDPREGVFLASSGAMASHLLSAPAPGYPKLASFTHTEGQVIVQVVVGRDGRVEATRVLDGPRLLRGAAEHAIRHWRYRPYLVDGRPTDVATIVTVSFRLRR